MKKKITSRGKNKDFRISLIDYIVWLLLTFLIAYALSVIGGMLVLKTGLRGIWLVLNSKGVLLSTFLLGLLGCVPIVLFMRWHYEHLYIMKRIKNSKRAIEGNLENSHFQTMREMRSNGYRIYETESQIRDAESGIILNLEERGKKIRTIFSPETIHTLVIGTTGSGKTSSYIIPSIKANALTDIRTRPSFLFTDPKGELHEKTAWYLTKHGYKVLALDFRHPELSLRWNPLAYAWYKAEQAKRVIDEVIMLSNGADGEVEYHLNGQKYSSDEIENAVKAETQRLEDEAYEELFNIVSALCPITSKKDPIWDEGAKGLILGVCLAMLEDGMSPDGSVEMTKERFNLYNLHQICTHPGAGCCDLIDYFKYRPKTSRAVSSAEIVLIAPEQQQGSYMSSVQQKLQLFNDRGVCNMTSADEIDLMQLDEMPTAIYIMLPDEKEGRHPLGSLFISQCYKKLVEKAVENGGCLKRKVFFMMDEYGNMPKINGVQSMFTVGRSRGIIQIPVIQSYSQIIDKYGPELARTIFGNCNTEIFIGSKDEETCKNFSEKLGNYTVMSANVTGGKWGLEHSYNEAIKERPLLYPRELSLLNNKHNMGNAVILNQGYSPTLGTFTPYFRSKIFEQGNTPESARSPRALDENAIYYEWKSRSSLILSDFQSFSETTFVPDSYEAEDVTRNQHGSNDDAFRQLTEIATRYQITMSDAKNFNLNLSLIDSLIEQLRTSMRTTAMNEVLRLRSAYVDAFQERST